VMVMVSLSWARAGKEKIKASIMAAKMLVITAFIYPSEFDETLLTVLGQSFSDTQAKVKCYNPHRLLSRPCPAASQYQYLRCSPSISLLHFVRRLCSDFIGATTKLWRTLAFEEFFEMLAMPYPSRSKSAR